MCFRYILHCQTTREELPLLVVQYWKFAMSLASIYVIVEWEENSLSNRSEETNSFKFVSKL